jgi:hypothetical protein
MAKTIVALLGLIGCAGTAGADPITILNDLRAVSVLAEVDDSGRRTDSQGPGDALSATAPATAGTSFANATARLTSSLTDPAHLSGSGSALASFFTGVGPAAASAAAVFAVDFVLDAPYMYAFNGAFNISDFPARSNGEFNEARWAAALSSGGSYLFNLGDTQRAFPPTFGGNLPAGTYHFLVRTTSEGSTERPAIVVEDSQFQFALDLTPAPDSNPSPTPEPTSILLVVTGIAGVIAGKTRTRRLRK